ncbi:VRR-NUC domain-containing protein [Castellaniella sp.]|uniref:VRR-NUC domain-containing protein n=1 Tax=Castellaniella sp. TaxID=1955812 RepID=UPI002AFE9E52|nr:VRR-NUC domain-containing protein [Castellaniella sp.]
MRESEIEKYLVERVKALGGEVRKVRWVGRNGAPDRLVMLPGRTVWVELKAPGEKCRPHQVREHERMRRMGQVVLVVDSFEGVAEVVA